MKKNGGFTLVELIIVIAILAILSTGAIAGYSKYIDSANEAAMNAILSDVQTAVVLANADKGEVGSIVVTEGATAKGKVTLTFVVSPKAEESLSSKFASNMVLTGAKVTKTPSDTNATYEFTLSVSSSAWESLEKYQENGATWTTAGWAPTT
jgi:prepilin-type N-terminal cleavage/methylation domain-containing protein